jgi:hypothetical protein
MRAYHKLLYFAEQTIKVNMINLIFAKASKHFENDTDSKIRVQGERR